MRKLPVGAAFSHMMNSTWNNLGFAARSQWPWFAIFFAALLVLGFIAYSLAPTGVSSAPEVEFGAANLLLLPVLFLIGLGFSSMAVAWHRFVLLDEVPQGMQKLRIDDTVWRYFGNLMLLGLATIGLILPVLLVFQISPVFAVLALIFYVLMVVLPVIYRLSIKLPAVAVGRRDFAFRDAWEASRGNEWQMVGLTLLMAAVSWGVGIALALVSYLLQAILGPTVGLGLDAVVQVAVNWVLTILGITLLTSLYGFFVEKRDF
jgi:hypothetical protein